MNTTEPIHSVTGWPDGIIELDDANAQSIGFTSDKYDGYLWKERDSVIVTFIESKQRGNFRELVRRIHALGLAVQVPTPRGRMKEIVLKNGYQHSKKPFREYPGEMVDVWTLAPARRSKQIITRDNSAVVINQQDDLVFANLYVNARNGLENADICNISWTGKTLAGARRWAEKQLRNEK